MGKPQHVQQVMANLADRLGSTVAAPVDTPFGVRLEPVHGLYAVDQRVSAPGLDGCSPRIECRVAAVGWRIDHAGVWYLLRSVDPHGGHALVHESDLRPSAVVPVPDDADGRSTPHMPAGRMRAGGQPAPVRPARFARPAAFSPSGAAPRVRATARLGSAR